MVETQRVRRLGGLAVGVVMAMLAAPAWAGTVYRWTDGQGVTHFSDSPPAAGRFSTQQLPDAARAAPAELPPPIAPGADSATSPGTMAPETPGVAGSAPAGPATPGTAAVTAPSGPARVVIVTREQTTVSDNVQAFTGKVKNEGGEEAHNVAIAIRVVEPTQGDECLNDEIDVDPPTLAPGATGSFDREFNSPCFHGPTQTQLGVLWE